MSVDVFVIKQSRYDVNEIEKALRQIFDRPEISRKFEKGKRILLKPNIISASRPEEHNTTNPAIVEAVARILSDKEVNIFLGDSSGSEIARNFMGYKRTLERTGIMDIVDKYNITPIHFIESIIVGAKPNHMFKNIEIAKPLTEMDAIINLPKLKTHVRMYLTLCVKNMFGSVVGKEKVQWHFEAGRNNRIFARILSEVYDSAKPTFNVLDGINGIEGDGRNINSIRHIGLIIAGEDGVAIDRVVCDLLNANPKKLLTLDACRIVGCGETNLDNINIIGDKVEDLRVNDFKFPDGSVVFEEPDENSLRNYIKKLVIPKPISDKTKCTLCRSCEDVCPTKAIAIQNGTVKIDYKKCITCFCCREMCSYDAMRLKKSIFYKFIYDNPFKRR